MAPAEPRDPRDDIEPRHEPDGRAGHEDEARPVAHALAAELGDLDSAEVARLSVLQPGTRLEQGSVYLDLRDRDRGPFRALAGDEAGPESRYVAKRDTDYELWNKLAGDRDVEIERPTDGS